MAPIKSIEYFRVKPRWLMVKIVDENGEYGWGEGTLEGHDLAVEGALDEMIVRLIGYEAEYVILFSCPSKCLANNPSDIEHIWQTFWRHGFYRGGPVFMSALSGIDIALWDLKGIFVPVPRPC
jgi:galactonate dehydratase